MFSIFFSLACRNRCWRKKIVVISALALLWKAIERLTRGSSESAGRRRLRPLGTLVCKTRETLENRCAFGSRVGVGGWGVSQVCPRVRGAPRGIDWSPSPREARRDAVGLHKYYWQEALEPLTSGKAERHFIIRGDEIHFHSQYTKAHSDGGVRQGFRARNNNNKKKKVKGRRKKDFPLETPNLHLFILKKNNNNEKIRVFTTFFFSPDIALYGNRVTRCQVFHFTLMCEKIWPFGSPLVWDISPRARDGVILPVCSSDRAFYRQESAWGRVWRRAEGKHEQKSPRQAEPCKGVAELLVITTGYSCIVTDVISCLLEPPSANALAVEWTKPLFVSCGAFASLYFMFFNVEKGKKRPGYSKTSLQMTRGKMFLTRPGPRVRHVSLHWFKF